MIKPPRPVSPAARAFARPTGKPPRPVSPAARAFARPTGKPPRPVSPAARAFARPTGKPPRLVSPAARAFLLLAIALFTLSGALFSLDGGMPQVPEGNLFAGRVQYGPLIGLLSVGIAAASFAVALLFMLANLLHQPEWEALVKTELYHVLVTVAWGVFLLASAVVIDQIVSAYVGGPGLFAVAKNYLNRVMCLSTSVSLKYEGIKMGLQYFAGMKSKFFAGAWGFVYPTFPGFEVIERVIDLIQMFIAPFGSSLLVQSIGLDVIQGTAITFIIPVGILMRLFPTTREAGAFLIASAFGLYFVFPFSYVIHAQVMLPLYQQAFGYGMCSGGEQPGEDLFTTAGPLYDSAFVELAPFSLNPLDWPRFLSVVFYHPLDLLAFVSLQAVFLPSLSMILVVSFIRSGTKFFSQKME